MIRDLHPHTRPQRTRDPESVDSHARELGFEPQDWPAGRVLRGAPALALLLGVALGGAAFAISVLRPDRPVAPIHGQPPKTPPPRLQPHPESDLRRLYARQDGNLQAAPVPVERAMDDVAASGWRADPSTKESRR